MSASYHIRANTQQKLNRLESTASKAGLKVNIGKTKLMTTKTNEGKRITVHGKESLQCTQDNMVIKAVC